MKRAGTSRARALVLGFYQGRRASAPVIETLRKEGFFRSAVSHLSPDGSSTVESWVLSRHLVSAVVVAGAIIAAIFFRFFASRVEITETWFHVALGTLAGAFGAWAAARLADVASARAFLSDYSRWLVRGESLVLVACDPEDSATAAEILSAGEGEHPAVFILKGRGPAERNDGLARQGAPLSEHEMHLRAAQVAAELTAANRPKRKVSLIPRLNYFERTLKRIVQRLTASARIEQAVSLSAEWLLDNSYLIQSHVQDFRRNLPPRYYRELPFIESGIDAGFPRIYRIAGEMVAGSDAHLARESIQSYLQAFQTKTVLTTGELWALPTMLHFRLIEYLTGLSLELERRQLERDEAAFWANRLLHIGRRDPDRIPGLLAALADIYRVPSAHFMEELLSRLYDEDRVLIPTRSWIAGKFAGKLEDVVREEQILETGEQVSLANAITTLRQLSQLDWRELFEAVSHLEAILWTDPAQVYGLMDFGTRDRYRHVAEKLSRRRKTTEENVAQTAIELALAAEGDPKRHVGYYLIDDGLPVLEKRLGMPEAVSHRLRRWTKRHPTTAYWGSISLVAASTVAFFLWWQANRGATIGELVGLFVLALLPASELAVQIVNFAITHILTPKALPKLSLQEGIPQHMRTLVVVPMMLLTPDSVRDEVERLEIRALANPGDNIAYALIGDLCDAPDKRMPEDMELLEVAAQGVAALNERHPTQRFLLFYRERQWCESEQCWMGWERKRGKLEDLNRYLLGEPGADEKVLLRVGDKEAVADTRFVITLDSDTQLPRDAAAKLVATIAHPLNAPHLAGDGRSVERGYSIIQPRVSTALPSATATLFTRLYSDPTGTDPYSRAVSDVYQDLAGFATYHGKGIYDLHAFHSVLHTRFPQMRLLSHDLIEGAFSRVALASDIELMDLFPSDYRSFRARQHRWIRGDWQIAEWVLGYVPERSGERVHNSLPALERMKILDNLRRSLIPAAFLALLTFGLFVAPVPGACVALVAATILAPMALQLLNRVVHKWRIDPLAWTEPGTNISRAILAAAIIPDQAIVALDAIIRVAYRGLVSKRKILEWATSAEVHRKRALSKAVFPWDLAWIPAASLGAAVAIGLLDPIALGPFIPFAFLWICSPFLVRWLDLPARERQPQALSGQDRGFLRQVARQTWGYYDEYVTQQSNWLPPDNYQDSLRVELAERSSPTNIGLYLLSVLAANDLGFIPGGEAAVRTRNTLKTIKAMERYRGHLFNWYHTATLASLGDRYVSMVDSGNLLACLWGLEEGLEEIIHAPVLDDRVFVGLSDTFALVGGKGAADKAGFLSKVEAAASVRRLLVNVPTRLPDKVQAIARLKELTAELSDVLSARSDIPDSSRYWAKALAAQAAAWNEVAQRSLGWAEILANPPSQGLLELGSEAHAMRRQGLGAAPSLNDLAAGTVPGLAALIAIHRQKTPSQHSEELFQWLEKLVSEVARAQQSSAESLSAAHEALALARELDDDMDMGFLYDREQRLFAVSYNVEDQRLDRARYDLLASEARLGSFVAIARGDVPLEHWWALGRPFGRAYLSRPLLSWSGTMFEYLMPLLLTRNYANSLLDQACKNAVKCQIAHATQRGIPWGISEAAYSALDSRQTYQYRAFGVPELALKRGVEEDFVVAPYATALALAVDPRQAVQNLRKLSNLGDLHLHSQFGYYDSIDYTRQYGPKGERGIVVQTYMAHHQGMIMLAIDNAVGAQIFQRRFHADPRVRATVSLLFERIPVAPPVVKTYANEKPFSRLEPIVSNPVPGRIDTADTPTPRTHLLTNGAYHMMVTNAGGGYSRWRDIELTRWRADTTTDAWGAFCYFKDIDTGAVWSSAHQPVAKPAAQYEAVFTAEKAEFRKRDQGIESIMEIAVSPEDNAEVRRITLINRTSRVRRIEVTTYCELALAPHRADRTHPAFNKMFIQTEALRDLNALLAWRRQRSPQETPVWVGHILVAEGKAEEPAEFETDRGSFLGRGRDPRNPAAVNERLSGQTGFVLDPIVSLRRLVVLQPNQRLQLASVLMAGESREIVQAMAAKYCELDAAQRALDLAWTQAQLEMRHLRIQPAEAQLFQQLASHVLYPHAHLRAPPDRIARNKLGQANLWAQGISGDLPIVLVSVDELENLDLVQDVLSAHAFWRSRGLVCDLVLLDQEGAGYQQPLKEEMQRVALSRSPSPGLDQPGGVFIRSTASLGPEDTNLLFSVARVVLVAARGSLSQQIGVPFHALPRPPSRGGPTFPEQVSERLPSVDLAGFNGIGGFAEQGKEYVIELGSGVRTPAPWANVLANPQFGALVTESGVGAIWHGNSQSNRITPWSNDPVRDPPGDIAYILDPDLNALWSVTPNPARENDAYRVCHGQGYTVFEHNSHAINQNLTVFVPVGGEENPPVRVAILKLSNKSNRPRTLVVTFYSELVLGQDREDTQSNLVTSWDVETKAIIAQNVFRPDSSDAVAFAACTPNPTSYTADRTEVLGRNGAYSGPSGLRIAGLSKRVGAALDPCAALQVTVNLDPGREIELVSLLGEAPDIDQAKAIMRRYSGLGGARTGLEKTREFWDSLLGRCQVELPDKEVEFLLNRWLPHQVLGCRYWGRTAFYQSGGAFGFRDQLQDVMALLYIAPRIAREHIIRAAGRQFAEGDVQHWWHDQSGAGVRTRISDDLLWLPYTVAQYVKVTGDRSILQEQAPYLQGQRLDKGEADRFFVPTREGQGTVLEHCTRAIQKGLTSGPHGLPLIGCGDWNDGLNLVGPEGKGESVWLAWFLVEVLKSFGEVLQGEGQSAEVYKERRAELIESVEGSAWDGEWYRRAYFDDGTPLGSAGNPEARIDSLAQSWAAITESGDSGRAKQAMQSVERLLVREQERLVLLFDPPFEHWSVQPGYIKGYPPGVRENGGQYTHGSLWVAMAWARLKDGGRAARLLQMMSPIEHTRNADQVERYRVEPYVAAADIYALSGKVGTGGWTWYTGAAGWMYTIWLEEVLGLKLAGERVTMDPVIPPDWPGFKVVYRFGGSVYEVEVKNPKNVGTGVAQVALDGADQPEKSIQLLDDGARHKVTVVMG